jgi:hypothetical protein
MKIMKPWQAPSNKTPSKRRKEVQREREREDPSLSQKKQNPKWVTKGAQMERKNTLQMNDARYVLV